MEQNANTAEYIFKIKHFSHSMQHYLTKIIFTVRNIIIWYGRVVVLLGKRV